MYLLNGTISAFHAFLTGKTLVGFGASVMPKELCDDFPYYYFEEKFLFFMDNDPQKHDSYITVREREIPVFSVDDGVKRMEKDTVLLITSYYYLEIVEQLNGISALDSTVCFVLPLLEQYTPIAFSVDDFVSNDSKSRIPSTIHYCWFGKNPIPQSDRECIESWKKFCPNMHILEWNESNYDIAEIPYIKEAYEAQKWAFVSDYARLDIIYRFGGLYFDTDVELVRSIDDLLQLDAFCAFDMFRDVNTGLGFGARPGNRLVGDMCDVYLDMSFLLPNGSYNEMPCTKIQTRFLKSRGLITDGSLQCVESMLIFPVEFFCPIDLWTGICHATANTYSIHRFGSSWWSDEKKMKDTVRRRQTRELLLKCQSVGG